MSKKINKVPIEAKNSLRISQEEKNKLRHTIRNLQLKEEEESKGILESLLKNDTLIEQKENLKRSLFYHFLINLSILSLIFFFIAPSLYFIKLPPLDWFYLSIGTISSVFF